MDHDISNLELGEIVNIAREIIGEKIFKLNIENANYPIIITKIHSPSISFEVWNRSVEINEDKPIELEFYLYHQTSWEDHIKNNIVFPTLENILEKRSFTLSEFDKQDSKIIRDLIKNKEKHSIRVFEDYYENLFKTNEITRLFRETYRFADLKTTEHEFEEKFCEFLCNIAIREIESDEKLQEKVREYQKNKEKQEKELDEHMKKVREKEKRKIEFEKMINNPKPKNSNNYNVRW